MASCAIRVTAFGFLVAAGFGAASPPSTTFNRDVAPIVYARCVPCHQADGDGPFSLLKYAEVRRRAAQIADVTARRIMPPWKPAADSPPFVGERRLSDADLDTIRRWVRDGALEGAPSDLVAAPPAPGGWMWGPPDLVLTLPPYTLRADGPDVFRNFVVAVPGRGVRYVRAVPFRPRNRAVHHANIRIDPTPASRAMDEADPAPGYEGVILHSADFPDGHFLGWTPGQAPPPSDDLAWPLSAGSDLVVQLHMRPSGRVETIAPVIGVYFAHSPPRRRAAIVRLGRQNLDLPAGTADYRVTDTFVLPVAAEVVAVQAHAHNRARDVTATATLPDRTRRTLLHIADWDFNWQDQYRLEHAIALPAGTTLTATYTFDNSDANPRNPMRPPARAAWGWRTSDEMGDVWIQVLTRSDRERERFAAAARLKMMGEDAIGDEVLVAREPDHVNLRNDAGLLYRELGQPDRALVHFAAVVRLQPRSAAARYNEGVTLELLGRQDEAVADYHEAIRIDRSYAPAHAALGNYLYRSRRVAEAIGEYREALTADSELSDVRCNLARALIEVSRPAEAAVEYRAALKVAPDSLACNVNFAWLLSAHSEGSIRRPAEAIALAEHAVSMTDRSDADALDVLAAAYASDGRFDAAVSTATAALRLLDEAHAPTGRIADVRGRLELYRQRRAFFVQ